MSIEITLPIINMGLLIVGLFLFVFSVRWVFARMPQLPWVMYRIGAVLFILLPSIVVALGVAGAFLPGVFPEMAAGLKILLGITCGALVQVGYKQGKQFMETNGPEIIKSFFLRIFGMQ